jgi:hypothetical protein
MKKSKKEWTPFPKMRAALRNIWRYSPMHREAIKSVTQNDPEQGKFFECPICSQTLSIYMATVDHQPPLGTLGGFTNCTLKSENLGHWAERLFYGPVRVLCKPCHKTVTSKQRKKAK